MEKGSNNGREKEVTFWLGSRENQGEVVCCMGGGSGGGPFGVVAPDPRYICPIYAPGAGVGVHGALARRRARGGVMDGRAGGR